MRPSSRTESEKMYFYESIAEDFDSYVNMYDLRKRLGVVFEELLPESLEMRTVLDAGCGTGWFSKQAVDRGARVTSMDMGARLLDQVRKKCDSTCIVGSILDMPFESDSFDVAICSEVVEHVTEPTQAIKELFRVLKSNGILILTTPNKFWYFSIWLANALRLRPYEGLENWLGWRELRSTIRSAGFRIEKMRGFHLFPFVTPLVYPMLDYFDRFAE